MRTAAAGCCRLPQRVSADTAPGGAGPAPTACGLLGVLGWDALLVAFRFGTEAAAAARAAAACCSCAAALPGPARCVKSTAAPAAMARGTSWAPSLSATAEGSIMRLLAVSGALWLPMVGRCLPNGDSPSMG